MKKTFVHCLAILLVSAALAHGEDHAGPADPPPQEQRGGIVTLWPLFDYRSSPGTGYSNLSILGPLFKREHNGHMTKTALRPLFFTQSTPAGDESDILYPLASTNSDENGSDTQVLLLFQKHAENIGTVEERHNSMLFPFYISGSSDKYGPYTSVFPLYGDIYERFWRDEYHFTLFPIYGRTVKKGTTSTNWLYPIFNSISGEKESGFAFWPLYGQSHKEGVYEKRFALWPIYGDENLGLDTNNPTRNLYLWPFYTSSESPRQSSTHILWPLCGVVRDGTGTAVERDYLWPFWMTARSADSSTDRYLPFYAETKTKEGGSHWIMWPIYRKTTIDSPLFRQEKTSLFYFLFHRSDESWPKAGRDRAQSAFWPLYAWKRDENGQRTLSMPALVEPVIWNDGVERNLAPLWRIFISTWDGQGNGATSILWNLFWREKRGNESAWELSPLVSYRATRDGSECKLLKGLFGYATDKGKTSLSIFWMPFGI
ncbi:hypothetical protein [Geobacter sp. AOG2]|uniref:hypothetical protein n=1 Tax=Geobacter sp. AOG2 TaxID=1566347 RepID=UPI001CC43713|nr:hypothetical protein [Geobacter sp. AOG2]GFE62015.1 hypothetical protein AOG2_26030 [Geobacter sp. AOG2]